MTAVGRSVILQIEKAEDAVMKSKAGTKVSTQRKKRTPKEQAKMWERIHYAMKKAGLDKITDEEIESEIQAARYGDDTKGRN